MKWTDIFKMASANIKETIADGSPYWNKLYTAKMFAAEKQMEACQEILCLEGHKTVITLTGVEYYSYVKDFYKLKMARYKDLWFLGEEGAKPRIAPALSSPPTNIYFSQNQFGFTGIPASAGDVIDYWYYRNAAPFAFRVRDLGNTATAITVQVTTTAVIIVVTGGINAATYTFSFGNAPNYYSTVWEICNGINTWTGLEDEVQTEVCELCDDNHSVYDLEVVPATSVLANDIMFFLNPELPLEFRTSILVPAISENLKIQDHEPKEAGYYAAKTAAAIEAAKSKWYDKHHGSDYYPFIAPHPRVSNRDSGKGLFNP